MNAQFNIQCYYYCHWTLSLQHDQSSLIILSSHIFQQIAFTIVLQSDGEQNLLFPIKRKRKRKRDTERRYSMALKSLDSQTLGKAYLKNKAAIM